MIRVVTDSAANLPEQIVDRFDVTVVPLKVMFGDESYREGVDLSAGQFYERLETSEEMPTTSQPTPQDFVDVYEPLLEAGHEIVSIHLSSELSGTYNSAAKAASTFEDAPITVFDTRLVSSGESLLVVAAARAIQAGSTRAEVTTMLDEMREETALYFTLDTLEYLKRGGRIGGASAFIGTLLRIKPLLQIKEGVVEPLDRVRSRRRAMNRLAELVADRFPAQTVWIGVAHGGAKEDAETLLARCRNELEVDYVVESVIGPVVGTHSGPGVVGIAVTAAPEI